VQRSEHDRSASLTVAEAESVADLVHDRALEIILPGANLRRVGPGVPVPSVYDGDLATRQIEAAEQAVRIAARGTGAIHVQDEVRIAAATHLADRHAVGREERVELSDSVLNPDQLVAGQIAVRVVHVDEEIAAEELAGRVRRAVRAVHHLRAG